MSFINLLSLLCSFLKHGTCINIVDGTHDSNFINASTNENEWPSSAQLTTGIMQCHVQPAKWGTDYLVLG